MKTLKTAFCAAFAAVAAIAFSITAGTLKNDGDRYAYLYSASSQCKIVKIADGTTPIFLLKDLKGESARIEKTELTPLLKSLGAKKTFTEQGENFYCEYYYTPRIRRFIVLNEKRVNLHVTYYLGVEISV